MHKILLVEDNEINRDLLMRRLQRYGFAVCCAHDGAAGASAYVGVGTPLAANVYS